MSLSVYFWDLKVRAFSHTFSPKGHLAYPLTVFAPKRTIGHISFEILSAKNTKQTATSQSLWPKGRYGFVNLFKDKFRLGKKRKKAYFSNLRNDMYAEGNQISSIIHHKHQLDLDTFNGTEDEFTVFKETVKEIGAKMETIFTSENNFRKNTQSHMELLNSSNAKTKFDFYKYYLNVFQNNEILSNSPEEKKKLLDEINRRISFYEELMNFQDNLSYLLNSKDPITFKNKILFIKEIFKLYSKHYNQLKQLQSQCKVSEQNKFNEFFETYQTTFIRYLKILRGLLSHYNSLEDGLKKYHLISYYEFYSLDELKSELLKLSDEELEKRFDRQFTIGKPPELVVTLPTNPTLSFHLNEDKIIKKINEQKQTNEYDIINRNCSTIIKEAILAGIDAKLKKHLIKNFNLDESFFQIKGIQTPRKVLKWVISLENYLNQCNSSKLETRTDPSVPKMKA